MKTMKKLTALLLALVMLLALAACGEAGKETEKPAEPAEAPAAQEPAAEPAAEEPAAEPEAPVEEEPALPAEDGARNELYAYADGFDVTDGKVAFEDISGCFTLQTVAGAEYYAAALTAYCPYDISGMAAAFVETTDGFVKYYENAENLYLLAFEQTDDGFAPIRGRDGASSYGIIADEENADYYAGVSAIYLVSVPAEFSVSVQVNGTEVGTLDMSAFMKKTAVGEDKVPTGMYDGSFKYNGGDSTWKGRFLGMDMATMLAKLQSLGMEVPAAEDCTNIEYYGYVGMGVLANEMEINQNYSKDPTSNNWFGNVEFYCMYDGYTRKDDIKETNLGLTCFINGTGSKWITYNIDSINFVTE